MTQCPPVLPAVSPTAPAGSASALRPLSFRARAESYIFAYMKQNTKDWIQYGSAIALIASAIVLAFTSFLVINDVTAGVNAYIGIALSCALAIFGITAYMVNQMTQFKTEIRSQIEKIKEEEHLQDPHPHEKE